MGTRIYRNESDIIKAIQQSYWRVGIMATMVSCVAMTTTAVMIAISGLQVYRLAVIVPLAAGMVAWLVVFCTGCILLYYAIGQAAFVISGQSPPAKEKTAVTPPPPVRTVPVRNWTTGKYDYVPLDGVGEGGELHETDK